MKRSRGRLTRHFLRCNRLGSNVIFLWSLAEPCHISLLCLIRRSVVFTAFIGTSATMNIDLHDLWLTGYVSSTSARGLSNYAAASSTRNCLSRNLQPIDLIPYRGKSASSGWTTCASSPYQHYACLSVPILFFWCVTAYLLEAGPKCSPATSAAGCPA